MSGCMRGDGKGQVYIPFPLVFCGDFRLKCLFKLGNRLEKWKTLLVNTLSSFKSDIYVMKHRNILHCLHLIKKGGYDSHFNFHII